jgi:hypothetical protein
VGATLSRVTVRQAVTGWLTPQTVTGLAKIEGWPSKVTNEGDFDLGAAGNGSGAVVFVHLEHQNEKRIALGGPNSGLKWRGYTVVLLCIFRGNDPMSEVVGQANDAFLDSLVARIQADRKLGTENLGAPIFQAGEGGDTGGPDIEVDGALPRPMRAGVTQVFSTVRFQVAEVLQT